MDGIEKADLRAKSSVDQNDLDSGNSPEKKLHELDNASRFGVRAMNLAELHNMIHWDPHTSGEWRDRDDNLMTGETYAIEGIPFRKYLDSDMQYTQGAESHVV